MQIIQGGDLEFDSLVYGDPHPSTIQYIQQNVATGFQNLIGGIGDVLNNQLANFYENFNGESAIRAIKSFRRKVEGIFEQDVIKPLFSIEELQKATLVMQRFIMAQPDIRALYHQQRCDGYSSTYIDMQPDAIGDKHYDYRRVMDGLGVVDDEDALNFTYYYDDVPDDEIQLTLLDKVDITSTWSRIKDFIDQGKDDPTSVFGDTL